MEIRSARSSTWPRTTSRRFRRHSVSLAIVHQRSHRTRLTRDRTIPPNSPPQERARSLPAEVNIVQAVYSIPLLSHLPAEVSSHQPATNYQSRSARILYFAFLTVGTMHLYVLRLAYLRQRDSRFVCGEIAPSQLACERSTDAERPRNGGGIKQAG